LQGTFIVQQSEFNVGETVRVKFVGVAAISGMVLFKGNAGDGKKIVGTKTIIRFDPEQYNKCDEAVENDE
jgi:hypothetical protein